MLFVSIGLFISELPDPLGSPNGFVIVIGPLLALVAILTWSETEWNPAVDADHFIPWKRSYWELLRGRPPLPHPLKGAVIEEFHFRAHPDEPALARVSVRIRFGDGRVRWVTCPWSIRAVQFERLMSHPLLAPQVARHAELTRALAALAAGERRRLDNLAERRKEMQRAS
jgi:hypothetical protein